MRVSFFSALLLASFSALVQAAPSTVSAVNMPAWLERAGQIRPLAPGIVVQPTDILRTGPGARLLLTLPEGSQIKIGQDAVFRLDNLNTADGHQTPFEGVFSALKGAFRFTTALLAKPLRRDVNIHVATITAGIRGTDIWGKADDEKDLVCLLEGKISVAHEGETASTIMDQPLDFFVAPKGKAALPVAKVDAHKVSNEWAPQTEPQAGAGLASERGSWRIVLAMPANQDEALHWYDTLREAGYAAKIRPLTESKFRVGIENLASEQDAKALGEHLKSTLNTPLATPMKMAGKSAAN